MLPGSIPNSCWVLLGVPDHRVALVEGLGEGVLGSKAVVDAEDLDPSRLGDLGHEGVVHFGVPQDEAATMHVHEEGERLWRIQVVAEHPDPARLGGQKELSAARLLRLSNRLLRNRYEEAVESHLHGRCLSAGRRENHIFSSA